MINKILKDKKTLLSVLFVAFVSIFSYFKLFNVFYQQDEWLSIGRSLLVTKPIDIFGGSTTTTPYALNFYQIIMGKGRFIPFFLGYLFFKISPFGTTPYALYSIFFHTLNTVLVYFLAKKFLKNNFYVLASAIFFAVNSVASNSVSWYGTTLGTIPSVTFVLLSNFTFLEYLKKDKPKWIITTFFLLYFSQFFKEVGVHLFLLYPFFGFIHKFKKEGVVKFIKRYWIFILFFVVNTIYRIYDIRFQYQHPSHVFLTGSKGYFWQPLLFNGLMYPLTSLSLAFIHPTPFIAFSRFITRIYYPFVSPEQFPLIAQTNTSDLLAVIISCIALFITYVFWNKDKKESKDNIFLLLLLTAGSYLPYIVVTKNLSYLESRYYYLAIATSGILFFSIFEKIQFIFKNYLVKFILIFCSISFLFWHYSLLEKDLSSQVEISNERRSFLQQLSDQQPTLTNDINVIYMNSDADYYLPGNKVPFQQGTGYTLMLWYYKSGKIPPEFFVEPDYYELTMQGYQEKDGLGFGFYSDKALLEKDISEGKFNWDDVVYFYYDSKTKKLTKSPNLIH